jgi:periplasmic glucans biosynthesis protein
VKNIKTCLITLLCVSGVGFVPFSSVFAATATAPQTQTIAAPKRFGFADVQRQAEVLAQQPFVEQSQTLPDFFSQAGYDEYRNIRYRQDKAIWLDEGLPFVLRLFHRGFLFTRPVTINLVEQGDVKLQHFNKDLFDYGTPGYDGDLPEDFGFAGMQIFFPLREAENYNEVAAFLGASYFRAVGRDQSYGLSARALALDTGLDKGEEFPFFREFWIVKPDHDATELTIYALLDSPSVSGAYRFQIKPGAATVFEVKSTLFFRKKVHKLGIAPLTSMYYHGSLSEQFYDDFRPQVHDSDGLLINFSRGEWLWRPLNNRRKLRIVRFNDATPRGFGLLQRDRDFSHYQDLEAEYHQRPSAWIEPLHSWDKGAVELVEIPTDAERNDNIASFWVPEKEVQAKDQLNFDYRLSFGGNDVDKVPGARVYSSRVGSGGTDSRDSSARKFVLDFSGPYLQKLPPDAAVDAMISKSAGEIRHRVVQYNPHTKGWRVFFELLPGAAEEVELRCFLRLGSDVLSETWSYQWFKP